MHERNTRDMRAFLDNPSVSLVPVGAARADRYSMIATWRRAKGCRIPTSGVWIVPCRENGKDASDWAGRHIPRPLPSRPLTPSSYFS